MPLTIVPNTPAMRNADPSPDAADSTGADPQRPASAFRERLQLLKQEGADDTCMACGLLVSRHYDSSGCLWMGCQGAIRWASAQSPVPEHLIAAKEHAVIGAARHLAHLLYPEDDADATTLSARELRCVIDMVESALSAHASMVQYHVARPVGVWRQVLDAAKGYRP